MDTTGHSDQPLVAGNARGQGQGTSLEARGVAKTFHNRRRGDVAAIQSIDVDAEPGEFVSIVGPSGCGKSTFLYIVGGFVDASAGTIKAGDSVISGPGPERGIVFQEFALFPWKTVLGNVTYGLAEQGLSRHDQRERAGHYLRLVGLEGMEKLYPKELSGGMKQRVAIARTLATDPDMLLMDEPLGALDAQTRADLQIEITNIWERTGKTIVFVTHAVEEAIYFSDRIYVFSQRPAVVKAVIDVDIERPRDRKGILRDPRFAELHSDIWDLLHSRGGEGEDGR